MDNEYCSQSKPLVNILNTQLFHIIDCSSNMLTHLLNLHAC